jgi:hypothetical protein
MRKVKCKEWRLDTLRADDSSMMKLMAKELSKLRNEDRTHIKKAQTGRNKNEKLATTELTQQQRPQTGGNATSASIRNKVQQHHSKARTSKARKVI